MVKTSLANIRRNTYKAARIMGDIQAVKNKRVGQRIANRFIGRLIGKATKGLWR